MTRGVLVNDPKNPIGLVPSDYASYQVFEPGDLAFKLIDLENISTSRVGLVPMRGAMSPAYIRMKPRGDVCGEYLHWIFKDMWNRNVFQILGGNGIRSSLTAAELGKVPLALPPVKEQQLIADHVACVSNIADKQCEVIQRKITLLGELRARIIHEAVTKGVPSSS